MKRCVFLTESDCEKLKLYFRYDNGRIIRAATGRMVGGRSSSGYLNAWANLDRGNTCLGVHRIIYAMHYGVIPEGWDIDHINQDKVDNRIENLRAVNHPSNMIRNAVRKLGVCELRGVSRTKRNLKKKYRAGASHFGSYVHLGYFDTENEAHLAYVAFSEANKQCRPGPVIA